MRPILVGCLLLAGCEAAELTTGGMRVQALDDAPSGCRMVGTIRDREGGGLRSFEANRSLVDARLRNEAARIGGDTLAVVSEERGDTDEGHLGFTTGVAGVATPNARCTNCVLVTAHVFQCDGHGPAAAPAQGGEECQPRPAAPRPPPPATEED
jgi:hypothetical protein